mmetsp:Transcript_24988/g.51936  ORF Transcript_24988/g.51936 Transcript_24988/m.51936 type:complete len:237 (+) Transcript_24988:3170-3880(+)
MFLYIQKQKEITVLAFFCFMMMELATPRNAVFPTILDSRVPHVVHSTILPRLAKNIRFASTSSIPRSLLSRRQGQEGHCRSIRRIFGGQSLVAQILIGASQLTSFAFLQNTGNGQMIAVVGLLLLLCSEKGLVTFRGGLGIFGGPVSNVGFGTATITTLIVVLVPFRCIHIIGTPMMIPLSPWCWLWIVSMVGPLSGSTIPTRGNVFLAFFFLRHVTTTFQIMSGLDAFVFDLPIL